MRSFELIAAEAMNRTGGNISKRTLMIAIELCHGETMSEIYPLRNKKEMPSCYIIADMNWNELVKHIRSVERHDIICTNTAFNEWKREIDECDYVFLLHGWRGAEQSKAKYAYAISKGKMFKHHQNMCYEY